MKQKNYDYIIISVCIITFASGLTIGYLINEIIKQKEIKKYKNSLILFQKKIQALSNKLSEKSFHYSQTSTEALDYINTEKNLKINTKENHPQKTLTPIPKKIIKSKKPKLVIIIDDVAFKYEVNMIKQIPFKITPSFFPATKAHPYTPLYAKEFPDYMVHLPMEPFNFPKWEPNTLTTKDSLDTIKNRILIIKKEFPRVRFINNHTGSKFTSNFDAMKKLFSVLKDDNLSFVDSKTTPISQSYKVNRLYHLTLFTRDIFLDNKENKNYILNQLKKAILIAKKTGYAIAIGHPHKVTLETLKDAKNLLNKVDVIYIDELAKYEHN